MRVDVLALDGVFDLGLSAILDAFQTANELLDVSAIAAAPFRVRTVGVRRRVRTAQGLTVPVHPIGARTADCVVVPAIGFKMPGPLEAALARPDVRDAGDALRRWSRDGATMSAACVGTFVMAESGVLDYQRATTTWWLAPLFRRRYGTQWERLHPLPPGIDRSRRASADRADIRCAFRREFQIGDDERLLLFVGSGFIKKGLDRAIEAFAALPDALRRASRLFVVGEDNAKPFEKRIARLGLTDRITFFSGREDVPRFLFSADALLLPAYDENTGTVILEAMIAGLPVLVTENCGYAQYVEQANAGLIVHIPYEQLALDDKLVELLTSPERDRWRQNGIAFGNRPDIYRLVETAVDRLEAFASGRYRRPTPKPEMAFCLLNYP